MDKLSPKKVSSPQEQEDLPRDSQRVADNMEAMNTPSSTEVLAYLKREDLPRDLQLVADVIGVEAMKAMLSALYGMTIYLRVPTKLRPLAERYVRANYRVYKDGSTNLRELAGKLGSSIRYVRSLLR